MKSIIRSPSTKPIATSHDRTMTYDKGPPPIKSHSSLVTWSYEIMQQILQIISLIPQGLWAPNLTGWWIMIRGHIPQSHMKSHDRKKALYFNSTRPIDSKPDKGKDYDIVSTTKKSNSP